MRIANPRLLYLVEGTRFARCVCVVRVTWCRVVPLDRMGQRHAGLLSQGVQHLGYAVQLSEICFKAPPDGYHFSKRLANSASLAGSLERMLNFVPTASLRVYFWPSV